MAVQRTACRATAHLATASLWLAVLLLLASGLSFAGTAAAQSRPVLFEVGFAGEIVAGTWNPLRVTLRDQPPAELIVHIDQGDLRQGEQVVRYRVPLTGGSGVTIFEDDLFVPAWRSFTWSVQSSDRVLASGTVDRRRADQRPLDLVISRETGTWRAFYPADARVVDLLPNELPERAAAFGGVRTLLIDGTTAPPRTQAVVAATASGVTTLLPERPPGSYRELSALTRSEARRLGLGWLVRDPRDYLTNAPPLDRPFETHDLLETLDTSAPVRPSSFSPITVLLAATVLYIVAVALLVRFGHAPGMLAGGSLALFASLAGWGYLQPAEARTIHSLSLSLGAGGLAHVLEHQTLMQLPGGTTRLDVAGHPVDQPEYLRLGDTLELVMPRWSQATLHVKPRIERAVFQWRDGRLVNEGPVTLTDVYVLGSGPQEDLPPGSSLVVQESGTWREAPVYAALMPLVPQGSAFARHGDRVLVALPEEDASTRTPVSAPESAPGARP